MKVFIIAGEASGDRLGAALMAGLRALQPVAFAGVGGPRMQEAGLTPLFAMTDLSVMGLTEVVPRYPRLRRRLEQCVRAVRNCAPDVLITIDSPDFCLRVARRVRAAAPAIRTVHYVAPSVWAWRAGRAVRMARWVDQVLALLPFEPPLMRAAGMDCDFVGHPVVADPVPTRPQVMGFRARHGLQDAPLLMLLPGSRRAEVARLAPVFGQVLARLIAARPDTRLILPTTEAMAPMVRAAVADWPARPLILDPAGQDAAAFAHDRACAFHAAGLALAASGSVSLELAAARTPMIIAYDMSRLSRMILARLVSVDTVTLVNLVSNTRAVPEFIGARCRADLIAPALLALMDAPGAQQAAMALTMRRLGEGGADPGLRAARAVLARM